MTTFLIEMLGTSNFGHATHTKEKFTSAILFFIAKNQLSREK